MLSGVRFTHVRCVISSHASSRFRVALKRPSVKRDLSRCAANRGARHLKKAAAFFTKQSR